MPRKSCSFVQTAALGGYGDTFHDYAFSYSNDIYGTQCAWDGLTEQVYNEYLSNLHQNVNLGEDPYFAGSVQFTVSAVPTRPYVSSWDLHVGTWFQLATGGSNYVIQGVTPGTYTIPALVDNREFFQDWALSFQFVPSGGGVPYPFAEGDADWGTTRLVVDYIGDVHMDLTLSYPVDGVDEYLNLTPDTATIHVNETLQMAVDTNIQDPNGITLGCDGGSIDANLLYTAPASPGTYHVFASTGGRSDVSTITVIDAVETPPDSPDDPIACLVDSTHVQVSGVPLTMWPARATSLRVETNCTSTGWEIKEEDVLPGEGVVFEQLDIRELAVRWVAVNAYGETIGNDVWVTNYCCSDEVSVPDIPNPPVGEKDCADLQVSITPDAFPGNVLSLVLERSSDGGATWAEIHTFDSAVEFVDDQVLPYGSYLYRWKACNGSGCSDFSVASAPVEFISTSSFGVWLSPASSATVRGNVTLKFRAMDANGVSNIQVRVNGLLVTGIRRISGNFASGVYAATINTRVYSQGATTLLAEWVGSDGCPYKIERGVTINNVGSQGVLYRDFAVGLALVGRVYNRVVAQLWTHTDNSSDFSRFVGLASVTPSVPTPVDENTDPEVAQAAFDAMQPLVLSTSRQWDENGTLYSGEIRSTVDALTVLNPTENATMRVRCEPYASALPFDTGCTTVKKIRRISNSEHVVWGGTPDAVFAFTGTELTGLVDITSVYSLGSIHDVAAFGDKVVFISGTTLYAYDRDLVDDPQWALSSVSVWAVSHPKFVEVVGGSFVVLDVDTTTQAYQMSGDQLVKLWSLNAVCSLAWSDGTHLYMAVGPRLYKSVNGTQEPVLCNDVDFAGDVVAIGPNAVGTDNGDLYAYIDTEWVTVQSGGNVVQAIAAWFGGQDAKHYVFGDTSAQLKEVAGDGSVISGLVMPDTVYGVPNSVTALDVYATTPSTPGAKPELERLLVGTDNDGVLYSVELSQTLQNTASFVFTSLEDVVLTGTTKEA